LIAPLVAVVAGSAFVGNSLYSPPRLSAAHVVSTDSDGDGLADRQESILSTSSIRADTDRDGFSDLEELARKTSPLFDEWRPTVERLSVGMTAHGAGGKLHIVLAVYCRIAEFDGLRMTIGAQVGGRLLDLSSSRLVTSSDMHVMPAKDPRSMIATLDIPVAPYWIRRAGEATFYVTVAGHGSTVVTAADTAELRYMDGVITLVQDDPTFSLNSTSGHLAASGGGGSVFRPLLLDEEEELPSSWSEDEICAQRSAPVGVSGAVVTQEVISAECQEGWDASCPPSCSSSVGSTHTTIDPVILIGG
jgi:hypothetical protein